MGKLRSVKEILEKNRSNIALIIGNGINRYKTAGSTNSWHDLLVQLAEMHMPVKFNKIPKGVSLTEFYDVLELKTPNTKIEKSLQQEFCDLMSSWKPYKHHVRIVEWAQNYNNSVLTTNFDKVLAEAGRLKLYKTKREGFTDFYPWESYYGNDFITKPDKEFGVWHINGMVKYPRSIRLGLTHYMGSVERARTWIHRGNENILYSGKDRSYWHGSKSWLHIIFNTPLLIFGLGLEESEVFLRWLLIERAKYFKLFPDRKKPAWYVENELEKNSGKRFFLRGVGIEVIEANSCDDIYGDEVWM